MSSVKDKRQKEAVIAWYDKGAAGTVEAITGIGKTWMALRAIYYLSTKLNRPLKVLLLAERTKRREGFNDEARKYQSVFNIDLKKHILEAEFSSYQAAYKWKDTSWDLVISDEIHDSLTPQYFKFYSNNSFEYIIGLSATIDRSTSYEWENDLGEKVVMNKGIYLDRIAPICYTYSRNDGLEDDTVRKLVTFVIYTNLNTSEKWVKGGTKANPFYQSENAAYKYWTGKMKQMAIAGKRNFAIFNKRKEILYKSVSKLAMAKNVLSFLEKNEHRTIVFGQSIDTLEKICPVVSYKNKGDFEMLKAKVESGEIASIGSQMMLKQGENILSLDTALLHSYYSKSKDFIQRVGRLRKDGDKLGLVVILCTKHTKEIQWLDSMLKEASVTPIFCNDIKDFKVKYGKYYIEQAAS